jgi:hypothetical protein
MENEQQQINPEFLKELEAISLQPMSVQLPELPQNEMTAAAVKVPPLIGLKPNPLGVKDIKNWCGQAAITSIIDVHGKNKFSGNDRLQLLLNDVYKSFPPDIFHGTFGTSANRIESALKNYGFARTVSMRLEPWVLGGFTNPVNNTSFIAYSTPIFNLINSGYPAIVMVDNGKLGGDWNVYHWMILYKTDLKQGFFCNAVDTSKIYQYRQLNINLFNQAWEAPYIPLSGFRFNVVITIP